MWNLPGPGVKLASPALAGGLLHAVPLGKSAFFLLNEVPNRNSFKLAVVQNIFIGTYKGSSSQGYGFSCGHVWM